MKIKPFFRWYDLWIGAYWDSNNQALYICPIPMLGIKLDFSRTIKLTAVDGGIERQCR